MLECRKVAVLCHTGSALRDECIEEDGSSVHKMMVVHDNMLCLWGHTSSLYLNDRGRETCCLVQEKEENSSHCCWRSLEHSCHSEVHESGNDNDDCALY